MFRTLQDMEGNLPNNYNLDEIFGQFKMDANKIDITKTPDQLKAIIQSAEENLTRVKNSVVKVSSDFRVSNLDDRLTIQQLNDMTTDYLNDPFATTANMEKFVSEWLTAKRTASSELDLKHFDVMSIAKTKTKSKKYELPSIWFGTDGDDKEKYYVASGLPTIIGGYTGIGKTTLAVNLAYHFSTKGITQQFYTLEMTGEQLSYKLLKIAVTNNNFKECDFIFNDDKLSEFLVGTGDLRDKYVSQLKHINDTIQIIENNAYGELTVETIEADIRRKYTMGTLAEIVYIDYAQILKQSNNTNLDRRMQIIEVMGKLTALAKKYKFALVLLSQTNRQDTASNKYTTTDGTEFTKAPNLFSLSESASIEQNASLVITVGREKTGTEIDYLHLSIEKNRFGSSGMDVFVSIQRTTQAILKHERNKGIPGNPNAKNKSK